MELEYPHGGPLQGSRDFLKANPEFNLDRSFEFLFYTQHPQGLIRKGVPAKTYPVEPGPSLYVKPGKLPRDYDLTYDDIFLGYDRIFTENRIIQRQKYKGVSLPIGGNDVVALAQFLWKEKPDVIIELGTGSGGSAMFLADMMQLWNPRGMVVTLDKQDRAWGGKGRGPKWGHLIKPIMCMDSCSSHQTVGAVWDLLEAYVKGDIQPVPPPPPPPRTRAPKSTPSVFINEDSMHKWDMVLSHLNAFNHLTPDCGYLLVQDTKLDRMSPPGSFYGEGGPSKALRKFLPHHSEFQVERKYEFALFSHHAQGWLRKNCPPEVGEPLTWSQPSASRYLDHDRTIMVNGRSVTYDAILFGFDLVYELNWLFEEQYYRDAIMAQDGADLVSIMMYLWEHQPDIMVELGTFQGGASAMYAEFMRSYNPRALVITLDPFDLTNGGVGRGPEWGKGIKFVQCPGKCDDPSVIAKVEEIINEYANGVSY